jgi:hypothetical protein
MPLVSAGGGEPEPVDEATRRARKVQPRYAHGEATRVAIGLNLAEAELMQGILLEEGIPSFLRRAGGFDVPDMLAAGPREILVPASGEQLARELLATEVDANVDLEREAPSRPAMRLAAGMLAGLLLFGVLAGLILALTS